MVSAERILLVAAEAREFDGFLAFCKDVRKVRWPVHWARSGSVEDRRFWMVANGAGAARAALAVDAAAPECHPQAIVSMGFCGALDPALNIGDVFIATKVVSSVGRTPWSARVPLDPLGGAGSLASIDHIAQTAAEKAALRANGASAVEMEAAGVAERAAALGIPFFCVKSVTDLAGQTFTVDFNKALLSSGHFGTIRILKSALGNPGKAFPELIRLRNSCRIATRTLGEFIAGCRF